MNSHALAWASDGLIAEGHSPDVVLTTAGGNWIPAADADVRRGTPNGLDSKGTLRPYPSSQIGALTMSADLKRWKSAIQNNAAFADFCGDKDPMDSVFIYNVPASLRVGAICIVSPDEGWERNRSGLGGGAYITDSRIKLMFENDVPTDGDVDIVTMADFDYLMTIQEAADEVLLECEADPTLLSGQKPDRDAPYITGVDETGIKRGAYIIHLDSVGG